MADSLKQNSLLHYLCTMTNKFKGDLEEKKVQHTRLTYRNDKQAAQFIHFIAEAYKAGSLKLVKSSDLFSMLTDSSADALKRSNAEGVLNAVDNAFQEELNPGHNQWCQKLVGFGADGASVMMGQQKCGAAAGIRVLKPSNVQGTRWICHHERALSKDWPCLVSHLEQVAMNGQSSDAKEKACGFAKELLQCQCAYFFHFLTDLFKILTRMSLEFQKNDNSAENVTRKLQVTLDGLRSLSTTPGPIERVFMEQMSKRIKGIASCSAENIWKVFRLQKCAARVILGADTKPNSVKLFKQLGWVPFYHEARINKLILVCKRIFGECPPYLTPMLLRN
ncbi:hypothetical protein P5673_032462, partial [Acropora cervicornis]